MSPARTRDRTVPLMGRAMASSDGVERRRNRLAGALADVVQCYLIIPL